ncbi:30S ribosome-binding factor RbfA [Oceanospirillum linum]|uniref:Ribosome-binding factor A n=1 Tax=Oceanospirillum linum TaxID=966 RepID=A0A1T1H8P1_OCELI|nr:30S ribosome-binding factor RbfA [Oceanospirillum linum]OOV86231.1 ribosome-binding factor A [Oceanospirillum linum]SEG37780.1 ribosome-binding factor A [Oleiphilus messinensis]SMP32241.1 ribosome-binding factor A [Oceanospirillum linum]
MSREFKRTDRISEQLQKELARIIQFEIKDPRLGMVTVNDVQISRDLSFANVYITVLGKDSAEEAKEDLGVLNRAAGFLRREIGKSIKLRIVPQLKFDYDSSLVHGRKLSSLIEEAVAADKSRTDLTDPEGPKNDTAED